LSRLALLVLMLAVLSGAGALAVSGLRRVGVSQGYAPEQPIAFSHRIHAGDNKVPCLYCHYAAERSRHAGIPPLAVCMNCHSQVKVASAEVEKLKEAVAQRRAVSWVKVHNLPDFVYFNHSQHVVRGIACSACHGPIERMERVRQVAPLTMGWCIGCHRAKGIVPPSQHGAPAVAGGTQAAIGGQDCSKCHY
jgi:hypothetical protein